MDDLDHCPLCHGTPHRPFETCRDHTVSRETFTIVECDRCGFRFTNPRPSADELGRYYQSEDYTPHQDTGQNLIDTLYRWVRHYTLWSKRRLIASLVDRPPGRLLDFGCGTGEFLAHCRSHGWEACGLEPDAGAQEVASATHGLTVEPPEHIRDLPSNHFDVITLWHVLEHVPKLSDTIRQLRRVLASTGTLIVAVPNCASLDAQYYGADWAGYDVPRHLSHFRPRDLRRLFDQHGLTVDEVRPMRLDAFYVSLLSERYRDGWLLRAPIVAALSVLWNAAHGHQSSAQLYLIQNGSSH
ncbi:class I SAM-dependent methyltransferase [Salinibacter altiplanensis]|uniref:class I SAM-dependent methyltransferase n=1 Tax=Salinibacter altiplanensis TaxID=1803181 RepID=UPI000C9F724D|nr:class I SAM-dependent methyltransferase [Salinibacter altiplanensis]